MTEPDLRAQLAGIQSTVKHVQALVEQAAKDRRDNDDRQERRMAAMDERHVEMDRRVTRLESTKVNPSEVHANTVKAAVEEATREQAQELARSQAQRDAQNAQSIRSTLLVVGSFSAIVASVVFGVLGLVF